MFRVTTKLKINPRAGNLDFKYSPLKNLRDDEGNLIDFATKLLNFDLNHPLDILTQESYDGSINLIINDGKNIPRLINSRISPLGNNKYEVVDRVGNEDTNLYDIKEFSLDTNLQKRITKIPKLEYQGLDKGGDLSVGNYHFYFRFLDADGNSTDIVAESGLVSVFIGDKPTNIHSGIAYENSNKMVRFKLTNIDSSYPYVLVSFTRATATEGAQPVEEAFQINKQYIVDSNDSCVINITGNESLFDISKESLNIQYININTAKTQAICQNRLFFGNVSLSIPDYLDLLDVALRIYIKPTLETYIGVKDINYNVDEIENTYYNSKFIYDKTGYWTDEYYRFGIVFLMEDYSLSPVFNIRGRNRVVSDVSDITVEDIYKDNNTKEERNYIPIDESTFKINNLDNSKGIYYFTGDIVNKILGLDLVIPDTVKAYLKSLNIKGYFLARLKRIPITLCLALTIDTDRHNHTPLLPLRSYSLTQSFVNTSEKKLFLASTNVNVNKSYSVTNAAICPDFTVKQEYYNNYFTGEEFDLVLDNYSPKDNYLESESGQRHYGIPYSEYKLISWAPTFKNVQIVGVTDSASLVATKDWFFSAKAGNESVAYDSEWVGSEPETPKRESLRIRGVFGPFIGINQPVNPNKIINIRRKISKDEFMIRASDNTEYFAISDRLSLDEDIPNIYRGDCYICLFTQRIIRNFNDSVAPYNDEIVDPYTWNTHLKYSDGQLNYEEALKINLGDVNAVKLGLWLTFTVRSNSNLNIRSLDSRNTEEVLKTGHPKGFYPIQPISTAGEYKHAESFVFNKGFDVWSSSIYHYNVPDVPYIKNLFNTRICYSEFFVNDSFLNGFRIFKGGNHRDYPNTYGSIVKLVELSGNLVCIFEHGIALIPVNERSVAANGDGGYAFINTSNVLPDNPKIISDQYGSQWPESIVKTPTGIYGIDTVAKKIWKTNGDTIDCISDFVVLEFLNKYIDLGERDTIPELGSTNVKTFYNSYKQDVMFTFYNGSTKWNLCFNEGMNKFITFYSWIPNYWNCIDNIPISLNKQDIPTTDIIIVENLKWRIDGSYGLTEKQLIHKNSTPFKCELLDYVGLFTINDSNILQSDGGKPLFDALCSYEYFYIPIKVSEDLKDPYVTYVKIKPVDNTNYVLIKKPYNEYYHYLEFYFWKHGQAGLMLHEPIKPTNWYGKQHPFEFEVVVTGKSYYGSSDMGLHKIFSNLELIANKAEPESFHYEIIGECFDFHNDKVNMYYRQEGLKKLLKESGKDIMYDKNFDKYKTFKKLDISANLVKYYFRQDSVNEIEDFYKTITTMNYNLSGAELVYYPNRDEYRLWNHCPAIIPEDSPINGNCRYIEDRWRVHINPITVLYKKEDSWETPKIPIYEFEKELKNLEDETNIDKEQWNHEREIDLKDKFIKIRIRYSGKDLAIINFLQTFYNISYG